MSNLKHKFILIGGLMLLFSNSFSQTSLSKINLASLYELNPIEDLKVHGLRSGGETSIFIGVELPSDNDSLFLSFWGADSYKQPVRKIDSLVMDEIYLGERKGYHYYQYSLATDIPLIAVEMATSSDANSIIKEVFFHEMKYDVLLIKNNSNLPVLDPWIYDRMMYRANDFQPQSFDLYVTHYTHDFSPAYPPMTLRRNIEKNIYPDSTFMVFDENVFTLNKKGFYLFQNDTAAMRGFGYRLEGDDFPKPNDLNSLIPPLRYICTKDEYDNITEEYDKRAFDKFWLSLGAGQKATRNMIRKYYQRVEHANRYFTTYKEGWKTDRGIIYIVYGPPEQVYRDENTEVWWYGDEVFQFSRFAHVFYPYNYALVRDRKYKPSWFRQVEKIRKNQF